MIIFIIFIQILSSGSQLFNFPSPELSFHKQEMPIKPGQLQQEQKNTSQVSFMSGSCHLDRASNDEFSVECLF